MSGRFNAIAEALEFAPAESFGAANRYLRWRAAKLAGCGFAEKPNQAPPEALLQQVWLYQRLAAERLRTVDGRAVKVLHPGFWNREPGPDFKGAVIQIAAEPPVVGDVEIDIVPAGWRQHAHATNPAYGNVVLHVTWEPGTAADNIPSLSLKHALDSTLKELSFWLGIEPKPRPDALPGQCSGPFRALNQQVVHDVIRQAAQARLRGKAEQLLARARQVGWNGALWEGLFSALGYKRNIWPMRRIAELLPLLTSEIRGAPEPVILLQARLLGASGMLPAELRQSKSAERYLRQVWDIWWRDADQMREHTLPRAMWDFAGIRPMNHPQRRLALAAHWLNRGMLTGQLEHWLERTIGRDDLLPSLEALLQVKHDSFWSYRCTLRSNPGAATQPLLGTQRITDLAINVILPWLFVRAWTGRNKSLAEAAEARYFLWPAGEDNSVLKLARQRLFGGVSASFLKSAAEQQGVMQIVRDFCDHSNAACDHCQFPDFLRAIVARE